MKAKSSSKRNRSCDREGGGLATPKKRRGPVFSLTREQVFRKCRAKKHRLICAGEVLALMDLMEQRGWSILELADHSHISRQMISAFLNLERFPTSEVVDQLACPFGLELFEFDQLACFEVRAEVPPWWHGAS
jgi:ribosome-binding protein aMBF1 (putative translation factor)